MATDNKPTNREQEAARLRWRRYCERHPSSADGFLDAALSCPLPPGDNLAAIVENDRALLPSPELGRQLIVHTAAFLHQEMPAEMAGIDTEDANAVAEVWRKFSDLMWGK